MPALEPVPNVLKVDIGWSIGSDLTALTRLFVSWSGTAPSNATCASLAAALYVIFAAELAVYTATTNALEYVNVQDLTSDTAGQGTHVATTAGSLAGGLLGAGVAFLASMKIGRRYRGGKPRSYLPLGDVTFLDTAQLWTSGFQGDVQASLNAIIADVSVTSSGGCDLGSLVNVSYYKGFVVSPPNPVTGRVRNVPTPRAVPVVDPVTAWVAEQRLSSQRRRNLRSS